MNLKKLIVLLSVAAVLIPGSSTLMAGTAPENETLLQKIQREKHQAHKTQTQPTAAPAQKNPYRPAPLSLEEIENLYEAGKTPLPQTPAKQIGNTTASTKTSEESQVTAKSAATKAAQTKQEAVPETKPQTLNPASYLLGPGDKLKIVVFGESDLSGIYTVNEIGQISFPLIGEVAIGRKNIAQTRGMLSEKLRAGYLKDPDISIEIAEFRPFYIIGEVRNPGSYPYAGSMTIMNAVALAGGFTYRARQGKAEVQRETADGKTIKQDFPINEKFLPGDIIKIEERFF